MRAMVITEPGDPDVLRIEEVADPVPGDEEVLIRVKAFGINHAETHMRKGEWPEATPISGIEAVGTVAGDPSGELAEGTKVDGSVSLRYDFADNPGRSFQAYVVSTGISSRLDGWQLAARYRGEFRLPFDEASAVAQLAYNTCTLTLQWDPSK